MFPECRECDDDGGDPGIDGGRVATILGTENRRYDSAHGVPGCFDVASDR
jgi:hypothetical protein